MPTYRHPLADEDAPGYPPAEVHITRAENATVGDDGVFEAPRRVGEAVAARFDVGEGDIRVDGEAEPEPPTESNAAKIDRGVCPWCSDYEGENVAQHASSAHPDEWAAYQEDDE